MFLNHRKLQEITIFLFFFKATSLSHTEGSIFWHRDAVNALMRLRHHSEPSLPSFDSLPALRNQTPLSMTQFVALDLDITVSSLPPAALESCFFFSPSCAIVSNAQVSNIYKKGNYSAI